jgi:N-acetylmuramoyl-L-alanine amidase
LTAKQNHWESWSGHSIADEDVVVMKHKNDSEERGWHSYTEIQLAVAMEVATVLTDKYRLIDVIGHDDIAPARKRDPGPAFPMASFRAHVFGRDGEEEGKYKTSTNLNIRSGPGTDYETLQGSPLSMGTEVIVLDNVGNWRFVDVLDVDNDVADLEGWVHGRYLKR